MKTSPDWKERPVNVMYFSEGLPPSAEQG